MGRVLFIVLAVFLLLGAFASPILDGIKSWRTDDVTESFSVHTPAGKTTANVTLSRDLFQNEVSEVIAITSNVTGESPIATSYTSATNVLLVSALSGGAYHTLAVNFYANSSSTVMQALGPFLGLFIIGGCILLIYLNSKK